MIKDIVEQLIKNHETNDPFSLASALGINIVYEDLGETMGYFTHTFRIKFIHINQNLSERESIFTCAHELGHAVQHTDVNTPFLKRNTLFSTAKIEREAHKFAVEVLLPDRLIYDHEGQSVYHLGKMVGIPEKLIDLKFHK